MPEGGVLTLAIADRTAPDGRPGLRIKLADTGPGLAEALIGELFKPFCHPQAGRHRPGPVDQPQHC